MIVGTLVLGIIGGSLTYSTARGTKVEHTLKKKEKNRIEIKFNNRYCDEPLLRDEKETRANPRVNQNSRGKDGEKSKLKEEKEREEHSRSQETTNEFADAYEMASLNSKAQTLKTDNAKEEATNSLNKELQQAKEELNTCVQSLKAVDERVNELTNEFNELDKKIKENEVKKKEIEQQMQDIDAILNAKEKNISDTQQKLLDNVDAYMQKMEEQSSVKLQVEFAKIKENGKLEVQQKLKQSFQILKEEVDKETKNLKEEQQSLENEINEKINEKSRKQNEIDNLRNQELNSVKNRVDNEKEIANLEAMQKRLSEDRENETKSQTTEEVIVMKEFKIEENNETILLDDSTDNTLNIFPKKQVINKDFYEKINKKNTRLTDIVKFLQEYSKKHKISPNILFGQLDFVINAQHLGIYEIIKDELKKKDSNTDMYKQFKAKEFFESIKKPGFLEASYKLMAQYYFKFIWKSASTNYMQEDIKLENYLEKFSLEVHY